MTLTHKTRHKAFSRLAKRFGRGARVGLCLGLAAIWLLVIASSPSRARGEENISLPVPSFKGKVSVEEALKARRTHRSFDSRALTLGQLSQVLWGAYGVSAKQYGRHLKTAPSAGALYPIDLYAVVGEGGAGSLVAGVYHFRPEDHSLGLIQRGDLRSAVAAGALHQMWLARAPVVLVITGQYARSSVKYGPRGVLYTHIEAGCVGQNIFLQAEALGLKSGIVGAFKNQRIIKTIGCPPDHDPLLIMPVGFPD